MPDDLSTQARELVERYRRSVHAMSAEHSAEVAAALAVSAVHLKLDSAGDPF